MSRKSIAFVYESRSSFVLQDLESFRTIARVEQCDYKSIFDAFDLFRKIASSSSTVVWGASGQAAWLSLMLAKITRNKLIVFAFGSEISVQERSRLMREAGTLLRFRTSEIIASKADLVICPSSYSENELREFARPRKSMFVYHAVNTNFFVPGSLNRDLILTVSGNEFERKGIDRFIKLASLMPTRQFALAGSICESEMVRETRLPNLRLAGKLSLEQLLNLYQQCRFYVQLSRHEAFGVSVAEAMSCSCVPIVSDSAALPETIGNAGFVIKHGNIDAAKSIIEKNWFDCERLGLKARKRVEDTFSTSARRSALSTILARTV